MYLSNRYKMKKISNCECTSANGRFGTSGAVARLKVCANLEVYRPCERQWKPRLRQAAGTLAKRDASPS